MSIRARYVHTNLIARNWRALADFYINVFGCVPVPPERDLSGPEMEAGTGLPSPHLRGMHLRLPGGGETGPTLEILNYKTLRDRPAPEANATGFGHLAFSVKDVEAARAEVLSAGGAAVGKVVTVDPGSDVLITWCYVRDPEGNILELQSSRKK